jgi:hypothetical protein
MISTTATFAGLVNVILKLISSLVPILGTLALALFLWGGVRYIYRAGDAEGSRRDREVLLWGLIALFILFSVWGIVRVLQGLLPTT